MSQVARIESQALLHGVRVVVVDDHPAVRDVVTLLLERFGATVTAVSGVPEALEVLERERPDVLVSDIEMPVEDGFVLIRKVRALRPGPRRSDSCGSPDRAPTAPRIAPGSSGQASNTTCRSL
jgi:CheY-like chemotaxis protein